MVYLDQAATSMWKPPQVLAYMTRALSGMSNAGRGGYGSALEAGRMIYEARERLCAMFGGPSPSRVAFTLNSTMALNIAIKGLDLSPGDEVVTTVMEHNSVLRPLYELEAQGIVLRFVGCDGLGRLRMDELESVLSRRTKAVVCTHASNLTGNVNDLYRIGRIVRQTEAVLIVDASQSAGVIPVRMDDMHIDVLCFTGHKGLCGPQGTGGLIVGEGVSLRPLLSGGTGVHSFDKMQPVHMPDALEAGTRNGHGIAGLLGALDYIEEEGMERLYAKEDGLARLFYDRISQLNGLRFYGSYEEKVRCPIVTLNMRDYDSAAVCDALACRYGIAVRGGAHCAPLMHKALGTTKQGAVRFSFSHSNTKEDVIYAVRAIKELLEE